jgi:hypothetical protein
MTSTSRDKGMRFLHLSDLPGIADIYETHLRTDCTDLQLATQAYFWAHTAYYKCAELTAELPEVFQTCDSDNNWSWSKLTVPAAQDSPKILTYSRRVTRKGGGAQNLTIFSIMGTQRRVDLRAVLDFAFDRPTLARKLEAMYEERFMGVHAADVLLEVVTGYLSRLPRAARVHPGIYLRAFQSLMLIWQYLEVHQGATPAIVHGLSTRLASASSDSFQRESVLLSGHSLGAACATLVYVWLQDLYVKSERDVFGKLDISCACIACPMFCDSLAWQEWFASRSKESRSRSRYWHFCTEGDVFVKDIPALAGFTHALAENPTRTFPDPTRFVVRDADVKCSGGDTSTAFDRMLMAHSTLQPTPNTAFVKAQRTTNKKDTHNQHRQGRSGQSCNRNRTIIVNRLIYTSKFIYTSKSVNTSKFKVPRVTQSLRLPTLC